MNEKMNEKLFKTKIATPLNDCIIKGHVFATVSEKPFCRRHTNNFQITNKKKVIFK